MPRLSDQDRQIRIDKRIAELEAGEEVHPRDKKNLLTPAQRLELDAAWADQKALRSKKRARTPEEQQALGWKSKRQVQIDILKKASKEIEDKLPESLEDQLSAIEVRRARIFTNTFFKAVREGEEIDPYRAADNALVRAGLPPITRVVARNQTARDRQIQKIEEQLLKKLKNEADDE